MQSTIVYLDYNATTPVDKRVLDRMLPYFSQQYANPSSPHLFAMQVQEEVEFAQQDLAHLIGCNPADLRYTSGATESINTVLKGLCYEQRNHIVCATTEHSAVVECCRYLETTGCQTTFIPVNSQGMIDLETVEANITADTKLVCIMLVNNETGVIQDIAAIADIVHKHGALLLCDATQAVGKMPIDVKKMGIDFMPISAHKFYGPKGIGSLYVNPTVEKLKPLLHGGQQQDGQRSGTLHVPGIIGLGAAARLAQKEMESERQTIGILRDRLEHELLQIDAVFVNGNPQQRIYNTTNLCIPGVPAQELILALGNIAVSSGSACSSITNKPSPVLRAMGLSDPLNLCAVRFSLGRFTKPSDIDYTLDRVKKIVQALRR